MAARSQVTGQIAIPLPPQMLRRSLAWQARRDQRAEYRAAFDETRVHGLRIRHVMKQIRRDTDESLRELGLMPAPAAVAPAALPNRPPAEIRPPKPAAAIPTTRPPVDGAVVDGAVVDGAVVDGAVVDGAVVDGAVVDGAVVDGAVVDGPTPPATVAEPAIPNPGSHRAAPPRFSDIAPVAPAAPKGAASTRPAPLHRTDRAPHNRRGSWRHVHRARASPSSKVPPSLAVARTASHRRSSIVGPAVPVAASGAGGVAGKVAGAQRLRAPPNFLDRRAGRADGHLRSNVSTVAALTVCALPPGADSSVGAARHGTSRR
jgi:hypothetical protein